MCTCVSQLSTAWMGAAAGVVLVTWEVTRISVSKNKVTNVPPPAPVSSLHQKCLSENWVYHAFQILVLGWNVLWLDVNYQFCRFLSPPHWLVSRIIHKSHSQMPYIIRAERRRLDISYYGEGKYDMPRGLSTWFGNNSVHDVLTRIKTRSKIWANNSENMGIFFGTRVNTDYHYIHTIEKHFN